MRASLRALEKNILKYRAFQMILLLHQAESLKSFVIGSIRSSDRLLGDAKLPEKIRNPMGIALDILVRDGIITANERYDLKAIIDLRNTIAHRVHELVADISAPRTPRVSDAIYDYYALERFERIRDKIWSGMRGAYVLEMSFRELEFEQAEASYKEELSRLRRRIDRQYKARRGAA